MCWSFSISTVMGKGLSIRVILNRLLPTPLSEQEYICHCKFRCGFFLCLLERENKSGDTESKRLRVGPRWFAIRPSSLEAATASQENNTRKCEVCSGRKITREIALSWLAPHITVGLGMLGMAEGAVVGG